MAMQEDLSSLAQQRVLPKNLPPKKPYLYTLSMTQAGLGPCKGGSNPTLCLLAPASGLHL